MHVSSGRSERESRGDFYSEITLHSWKPGLNGFGNCLHSRYKYACKFIVQKSGLLLLSSLEL